MSSAKLFFTEEEKLHIISAIGNAEKATSGEIRLHLEETCGADVILRATQVFTKLKMHKTALKNGVLIYLAVKDKKFAIIGDTGIHTKLPDNFWDSIKQNMQMEFAQNNFLAGITHAIYQSGEQLKQFFPYQSDDVNEVSDEISFNND